MPEPHTYHVPNSTAHLCTGIDHHGLAEALTYHGADIVVSDVTKPGGRL